MAFSHEKYYLFIKQGSGVIKKDSQVKHARRVIHQKGTLILGQRRRKSALNRQSLKRDNPSLKKMLEEEREKLKLEVVLPLFTTEYFIAYNDESFLDGEKLVNF